ncbi:MAG: DUF4864 domain-containing protein [Alphaproteobacteria bacterium]
MPVRQRFLLILIVAAASFGWTAPAAADADADIRAVIVDQIDAISAGDGARAFGLASPGVQDRFGSAEGFMFMVEQGFGPLVRPRAFEVEEVRRDGDRAAARARVVARDGRLYLAFYPLSRQPDGRWRIDGCQLKETPGQAL